MAHSENGLLETLLLTSCLLIGKTSFGESGAKVSVKPEEGETMLFFSIDDPSNSECKLRQLFWGNKEGENLCDLIVFYATENKRVFCFVELKANIKDLGHATKQVTNTYTHFKQHLKLKNCHYTARSFISAPIGSIPQEKQKYADKLKKVFGEGNFKYGKLNDLGKFLRDGVKGGNGKRKRK